MRNVIVLVCVLFVTSTAFGLGGDQGYMASADFVNTIGTWADVQYNFNGTIALTEDGSSATKSDGGLGGSAYGEPGDGQLWSQSGGKLHYDSNGVWGTKGAYKYNIYSHGWNGYLGNEPLLAARGRTYELGSLAVSIAGTAADGNTGAYFGFVSNHVAAAAGNLTDKRVYQCGLVFLDNGLVQLGTGNTANRYNVGDISQAHTYRVMVIGDPDANGIVTQNLYVDEVLVASDVYAGDVPDAGHYPGYTGLQEDWNEGGNDVWHGTSWGTMQNEMDYTFSMDYTRINEDAYSVPEPATMLLLLGGGLLGLKRRKK